MLKAEVEIDHLRRIGSYACVVQYEGIRTQEEGSLDRLQAFLAPQLRGQSPRPGLVMGQ
jgi:hypothetical protein